MTPSLLSGKGQPDHEEHLKQKRWEHQLAAKSLLKRKREIKETFHLIEDEIEVSDAEMAEEPDTPDKAATQVDTKRLSQYMILLTLHHQ
ncbi:MAG: hypothetical protein SGPRY_004433, partial [Prymnesium sp.]